MKIGKAFKAIYEQDVSISSIVDGVVKASKGTARVAVHLATKHKQPTQAEQMWDGWRANAQ